MVNSLFKHSKGCPGGNTLFLVKSVYAEENVPYYIPKILTDISPSYDFNNKIKYINHILHRIVYNDYDYPLYSIENNYNIILRELSKIKLNAEHDTLSNYNVLLKNIISTFETLESTFKNYIKRTENDYELPSFIYDHIALLQEFIKDLYNETIPDTKINKINEELESVLNNLYKNVGEDLEKLLKLYSTGNFTKLQEELTYEVYNELSQALFKESYEKSIGYTNVYSALNRSLEGLYKSALLEDSHKTEITQLKARLKLAENPQSNILSVASENPVIADVKPEILEYIKLWGFPEGAVFEPEKLAQIIKKLDDK